MMHEQQLAMANWQSSINPSIQHLQSDPAATPELSVIPSTPRSSRTLLRSGSSSDRLACSRKSAPPSKSASKVSAPISHIADGPWWYSSVFLERRRKFWCVKTKSSARPGFSLQKQFATRNQTSCRQQKIRQLRK